MRTKLMLDSIDAWLLVQPTLVNARKRTLLPVVRERLSLSAHLVQVLKDLGLERKAREIPSLSAYLVERASRAVLPPASVVPPIDAEVPTPPRPDVEAKASVSPEEAVVTGPVADPCAAASGATS